MPDETSPPPDLSAKLRARQKTSVTLACSLLVVVALALLVLPLAKVPYPMRIGMAVVDLIAASALWLIARQKFNAP
ncbi:MAG: hypothetical protein ABIZ81_06505 [Opitutaceae bacterium]